MNNGAVVEISNQYTTVGRLIFNQILPEQLKYTDKYLLKTLVKEGCSRSRFGRLRNAWQRVVYQLPGRSKSHRLQVRHEGRYHHRDDGHGHARQARCDHPWRGRRCPPNQPAVQPRSSYSCRTKKPLYCSCGLMQQTRVADAIMNGIEPVQPDLHHHRQRRPWFQETGDTVVRHARPDDRPVRQPHRGPADQVQLP